MAKITPGAIISEISGSIANVTYSRSKYGMYSKAKLNQTNPDTPAQQAARAIAAAATAAWQALAPDEQAAWNQFAVGQLSKSRLSLRSILNGYNAFIRFYITRNTYGLTGNPDRVNEQPLGTYSGFAFAASSSAIDLTLIGDNTNTDIMAVARLSGPRSPGQSTITQSMVVNMDFQQAPNGSLTFNLLSSWEAKWGSVSSFGGQKIFAQIDIVNRLTAQKIAVFRGAAVLAPTIDLIAVSNYTTGGGVLSSLNALAWIQQATQASKNWTAVCWSPDLGLWCAVSFDGSSSDVMTSPDGITWTVRTTPSGKPWFSVCWAPSIGLFIAVAQVGSTQDVMTSPDGINWTLRTTPNGFFWGAVCWSESLGLAVATGVNASGTDVMTSPDGINWTLRTTPAARGWAGVCWCESIGLFIATSYDNSTQDVMTSPDGITWTLRNTPGTHTWIWPGWSETLGLAVACAIDGTGNDIMTSPDGITWTIRSNPSGMALYQAIWSTALGLFVAVSNTNAVNQILTSPDGITWTQQTAQAMAQLNFVNSKG